MSYYIQIRVQWDGEGKGYTTTVSPSHTISKCTDLTGTLCEIIWSESYTTRHYKTRKGAEKALNQISLGQEGRALITGQIVEEDGQSAHNVWRS